MYTVFETQLPSEWGVCIYNASDAMPGFAMTSPYLIRSPHSRHSWRATSQYGGCCTFTTAVGRHVFLDAGA